MNAYETGIYRIELFDKHGSKQHTEFAPNYVLAVAKGGILTEAPPFASFVVTRVLYNSIDKADPWSCKDHEQST